MAYRNPATGSWTIYLPKDARTGKFVSTGRVIESNQATREEPPMESNALRRITTAVGNSLDITDLENQLDFWLDEIDTVDWITEGEIYVLGHYDDEERGFTLRIELDGEN